MRAIADTHRSPKPPDIPTTAEAGSPELGFTDWFAGGAVADTTDTGVGDCARRDRSHQDAGRAGALPRGPLEPIGNSPAEMAAFVKQEAQRWSDVIRKNNIVVD